MRSVGNKGCRALGGSLQKDKQYTLVFGDANESTVFCVMLMDSRYVVMQMNWPFLVTGESQ
jgi:hypothetical protein